MKSNSEIKTVFVGDIAFNRDITPHGDKTSIGGAAYYCAVGAMAAHQEVGLNASVGVVSVVGGDFDLDHLLCKKIDTLGVTVIPDEQTCRFTLTQYSDNTRSFEAERGVAAQVRTDRFPSSYLSAHHIHLATSLPQNYEIWQAFLREQTAAQISIDAFEVFAQEFPELTIAVLNASDLIFINEAESHVLTPQGLVRAHIPWLFKKGAHGASYLDDTQIIEVIPPKVSVVDTTGAGDVLAGAFLTLLSHGYHINEALQIGVGVASQSITEFGVEHLLE